ncbi:hypothetical protein J4E93_003804 [Alternaria ventricosa]|uniref:uncharacterized protein n=1 Tax=Alternaria ventricosa TaxID=1187951 RepID=UPI0020C594D6|nr:uncharacterized protein J4E93_003804 [Alternaria ventricosa]KAI4649484.1 hypothetical protein J4E93_003804 [Alternaria ventricosa]
MASMSTCHNPSALFLILTDSSYALGACHWSAPYAGLCLSNDTTATPARPFTTFYHNLSSYNIDNQGILNLPVSLWGRDDPVSSAMRFDYEAGTNLVEMTFALRTDIYQLVCFEEDDASMYIAIDEDDTGKVRDWVFPPKKVKNWYMCPSRYNFKLWTLAWKIGVVGEPQNPTCSKVDVVRVWA